MSLLAVNLHPIALDVSQAAIDACWQFLDDAEQRRANQFRRPELRNRWLVSRAGLRGILALYCSSSPEGLRFDQQRSGKPVLHGANALPDLHFNLSHSHNLAVVAVTTLAPVGVDIEYQRPLRDWKGVAQRFFSSHENEQLSWLAESQRQHAFYCCWTRKESVIKASGEGLSARLDAFDVSLIPGESAEFLSGSHAGTEADGWWLRHLDIADRFVGAIAVRTSEAVNVTCHQTWCIGDE